MMAAVPAFFPSLADYVLISIFMEDIRPYRNFADEKIERQPEPQDDRREWSASRDEEVPFHIPRD